MKKKRGFTLIELAVVVGITALMLVMAFPNFQGSKKRSALDDGEALVRRSLEMSRSRALTGAGGKNQGIRISANALTVFEDTYDSGALATFTLPPGVSTDQSDKDIIFKRLSGETGENVSIVISHSDGNSRAVEVRSEGTITPQ